MTTVPQGCRRATRTGRAVRSDPAPDPLGPDQKPPGPPRPLPATQRQPLRHFGTAHHFSERVGPRPVSIRPVGPSSSSVRSGELQPELVELEVSETGLMDDPAGSLEILSQLSGLGIKFIVDDFGTGYTPLSTMQHLPVTGLKIDSSYVSTISASPSDRGNRSLHNRVVP